MSSWGGPRGERQGSRRGCSGERGGRPGRRRKGAAAAARLGPAPRRRARRRSGRRSNWLRPSKQVGQADLAARPVRSGTPWFTPWRGKPPGVSAASASRGAGQLLLLHQQLGVSGHPTSPGETIGGRFISFPPSGDLRPRRTCGVQICALADHPLGRLVEHRGSRARARGRAAPLDHAADDAGLFEHLQVLGDRGPWRRRGRR